MNPENAAVVGASPFDDDEEADIKELTKLIKEAGDDMRRRRQKTLKAHYNKLRSIAKKASLSIK
ncbi:MAG: hypothetical protein JRJ44_08660 [Deltaproteobacteria bacterium]|nr:hypothetical protein [Deltaproteobacteria bacterium]